MKTLNILLAFLLPVVFVASAQKLPSIQTVGIYAPSNVIIDGILAEWGNLQAHNNSVELSYTLANDNDNIYLAVQATNPRVIQKLLMTGLTLIINTSGKKDGTGASVDFPLLNFGDSRHVLMDAGIIPNVLNNIKSTNIDSLTKVANTELSTNAKEIKIFGISGITDTIAITDDSRKRLRGIRGFREPGQYITTKNKYGISAMAHLNNNKELTYELAIPLKYLGLAKGSASKITYNIKLNGLLDKNGNPAPGAMVEERRSATGVTYDPNADLDNETNFFGEYVLVKK